MTNNLKKNFVWNTIGSTLYAFTSLFFMIIVTRINGVDDAGIFTFAFSLANLMQFISLYSGRTFQVTERNKKITDSDFAWQRYILSIFTFIVIIFYLLTKNYSLEKNIIILLLILYKVTDSISDLYYGILQKNDLLYKAGISFFIKGILCTIIFLLVDLFTKNIKLSLVIMIACNILICIFYDYLNVKRIGYKISKVDFNNLKTLFITGFSVFAFNILIQYLVSAQKYAIDGVLSDKYQTIFGIIIMPTTMIALLSQFVVQPYLTKINEFIKNDDNKGLNKLVYKLLFYCVLLALLSISLAYLIGPEVLSLIYGLNLKKYRLDLCLALVGALFYSMAYVFTNVLIAKRKNNIQLIIYLIVSIIAYFISKYLVIKYKLFGASLAYTISMLILFILFVIVYNFIMRRRK